LNQQGYPAGELEEESIRRTPPGFLKNCEISSEISKPQGEHLCEVNLSRQFSQFFSYSQKNHLKILTNRSVFSCGSAVISVAGTGCEWRKQDAQELGINRMRFRDARECAFLDIENVDSHFLTTKLMETAHLAFLHGARPLTLLIPPFANNSGKHEAPLGRQVGNLDTSPFHIESHGFRFYLIPRKW
jgi:hypothetical protein